VFRFYKKSRGHQYYWEIEDIDTTSSMIHFGRVGQEGTKRFLKSGSGGYHQEKINKQIKFVLDQGYSKLIRKDYQILVIEYEVEKKGAPLDYQAARYQLEFLLKEILKRYGLGCFDENNSGSEFTRFYCYVVDFELAKEIIDQALKKMNFKSFSKIYLL
tara:strand:+ start:8602 stop:9078 length:477 start_codon:yes stop_codon:yes gene_type:complete